MTLTKSDIEKIIKTDLKDWKYTDSKIVRFIPRSSNLSFGTIVKEIWDYAEKVDHHPDILLTYSGVKITLFTHDQSGVTEKDIKFALSLAKIYWFIFFLKLPKFNKIVGRINRFSIVEVNNPPIIIAAIGPSISLPG